MKRLKLWQVGLILLALHLAAFFAIWQFIRLISLLGPVLSIVGASVVVAWAFLTIHKLRADDEWMGS